MAHTNKNQSPPTHESYQPGIPDLLSEIYQLLTYFLASRPIALLDRSPLYGERDPIHKFETIERDLITKRLMYVAITIRVLDDRGSKMFEIFTDYCGSLVPDTNAPSDAIGLGLREACNKIIHARRVEFDSPITENGTKCLLPYLYLHGEERGRQWSANLDIVKFSRECSAAILHWI